MRKRGRKKSLFADRSNLTALYVLLFYFVTIHNLFLDLVTATFPNPPTNKGKVVHLTSDYVPLFGGMYYP